MKVWIKQAEWYPVYKIDADADDDWSAKQVEVENSKIVEWKLVFAEFERVQNEMRDCVEAAEEQK